MAVMGFLIVLLLCNRFWPHPGDSPPPRLLGAWARIRHRSRNPAACMTPTTNTEAARPEGFRRVAQALRLAGHGPVPRWLEVAARTSQEAADALGVALGQIAKSVVFRRLADDGAVLVIASGDRRIDEQRLAAEVGAVGRADAVYVKARTGFAIGGVSPVALAGTPTLLLDRELQRFGEIWAAAGHPNGVFQLTPQQLQRLTGAPWADVVQGPA
jgi:prolyl-tRNA editing enzyme YbaK/EbsC (Cys-tRNA(Pro) deacylase)